MLHRFWDVARYLSKSPILIYPAHIFGAPFGVTNTVIAPIYLVSENYNMWFVVSYVVEDLEAFFWGRGSKITGWSKARQQMLKLWGLF